MKQKQTKYKGVITLVFTLIFIYFSVLTCAAAGELIINRAWLDGDMLRIEATDINGVASTLALRLSDYVSDTQNEFISLQAADLNGNTSGIIQIKNPYYLPLSADTDEAAADITVSVVQPEQSSTQNGGNAFTPSGTGTVIDNVMNGDGKEFFTVGTEDGNIFYLIVDRERNSDNVYLLNAVTEEDLISLAQKKGRAVENEPDPPPGNGTASVTESPVIPITEPQAGNAPAEAEPVIPVEPVTEAEAMTEIKEKESEDDKDDGNALNKFLANSDFTMLIIIVIVMGAAGAAIFIIKRRKGNNGFNDFNDDNDNYDYGDNADNPVIEQDGDNDDNSEEIVSDNEETHDNQGNDGDNNENNFEDGDNDEYN